MILCCKWSHSLHVGILPIAPSNNKVLAGQAQTSSFGFRSVTWRNHLDLKSKTSQNLRLEKDQKNLSQKDSCQIHLDAHFPAPFQHLPSTQNPSSWATSNPQVCNFLIYIILSYWNQNPSLEEFVNLRHHMQIIQI